MIKDPTPKQQEVLEHNGNTVVTAKLDREKLYNS